MKNYSVVINGTDDGRPLGAEDIFMASDLMSEKYIQRYEQSKQAHSHLNIQERLERILEKKSEIDKIFLEPDIREVLKEYFYVDGAISFNKDDLAELEKLMYILDPKNG